MKFWCLFAVFFVFLAFEAPVRAQQTECTTAELDLLCDPGEYLEGIRSDGTTVCKPIVCPDGQVLQGLSDTGPECVDVVGDYFDGSASECYTAYLQTSGGFAEFCDSDAGFILMPGKLYPYDGANPHSVCCTYKPGVTCYTAHLGTYPMLSFCSSAPGFELMPGKYYPYDGAAPHSVCCNAQ